VSVSNARGADARSRLKDRQIVFVVHGYRPKRTALEPIQLSVICLSC